MSLGMRAQRWTRRPLNTAVGKWSMVNGWTLYTWANKHFYRRGFWDTCSESGTVPHSTSRCLLFWMNSEHTHERRAGTYASPSQGSGVKMNTVTRPPRCRTPLLYYDRKVDYKHGSCPRLSLILPLSSSLSAAWTCGQRLWQSQRSVIESFSATSRYQITRHITTTQQKSKWKMET